MEIFIAGNQTLTEQRRGSASRGWGLQVLIEKGEVRIFCVQIKNWPDYPVDSDQALAEFYRLAADEIVEIRRVISGKRDYEFLL